MTNKLIFLFFPYFFWISIESFSQSLEDTLHYQLDLNLSGRRISGEFSQAVIRGGFDLDLTYKNWHLENSMTYRYNKANTTLIEDNWNGLVTLHYYPGGSKKLYPGLFSYFDNSLIYRIKSRHNFGAGFGSEFDKGLLNLSLMGMIANGNSSYDGSEFVNSNRDFSTRKNGFMLFILENRYRISKELINFSYRIFYFQSLKEKADYIIKLNPQLNFKLLQGFSFYMIYEYRFENVHLENLSSKNDILLFGFNLKLKR
ncbi:MAG: DUF481 domain-containing protein [Bacteroidota bacterium]